MRHKSLTHRDANHAEIKAALQALGFQVVDLAHVGEDVPDLLASTFNGLTLLGTFDPADVRRAIAGIPGVVVLEGATLQVEVKTETGKLSKGQEMYRRLHPVLVVRTVAEVERLRQVK